MLDKEYDLLVFIGRFQPFHMEHKRIIDVALEKSHNVLVLVGSAGKARTVRNPFTFAERALMVREAFDFINGEQNRIITRPIFDKTYNDAAWVKQIQSAVTGVALELANPGNPGFKSDGIGKLRIGLIGASKDHTSYYLKMFPQWDSVNVTIEFDLNATEIREAYLADESYAVKTLPANVHSFLERFRQSSDWYSLHYELEHVRDYKKQWAVAPYPVKHMTVDAVVEQSGHILLVRRRSEPGKGLWALPGGHLEEFERLEDGMIRELREETKIKVPDPVLRGSIVAEKTFDDPYRSTIGRVITQAFHIKLVDATSLPKVKGSDDAEKAVWVPIAEITEDAFFDDHYHIITHFLGL